jgi:urease accessory protein
VLRPTLYIALNIALWLALVVSDPAFAHHAMGSQMPATFVQGLLSGLGHPIIGLDHLAALIAVGCLAATQARGLWLPLSFVVAMVLGAALHVRELTLPASEILAASSVLVLGALLVIRRRLPVAIVWALFAAAGLVHGYALAESIIGAEPTPLYAYFAGLAIVQSAIALGAMLAAREITNAPGRVAAVRLIGAGIAGIGVALVVQQIAA